MEEQNCLGCGMHDPCGVHYEDCTELESGDWVVPRNFIGYREDASKIWEPNQKE